MKNNTNNRYRSLGLFIIAFLFFLLAHGENADAATLTLNSPTSTNSASGSAYVVDVSVAIATADKNVTNVTFAYRTASGGALTIIGGNTSNNLTRYTLAWDTTGLTDDNTFVINITAYNFTVGASAGQQIIGSLETTGLTVDNTVPTSSYGTSTPANGAEQSSRSVTINTASDNSVNSCTLFFGTHSAALTSYAGTVASGVCSVTRSNLDDNSYTYYLTDSDSTNSTTLATRTIKIRNPSAGANYAAQQQALAQQQQQQAGFVTLPFVNIQMKTTTLFIIGAIAIGLFAFARRK